MEADAEGFFGAQPERPASLLEIVSRLPPHVAAVELCKCVSLTDTDEQKIAKLVTSKQTCASLLELYGILQDHFQPYLDIILKMEAARMPRSSSAAAGPSYRPQRPT